MTCPCCFRRLSACEVVNIFSSFTGWLFQFIDVIQALSKFHRLLFSTLACISWIGVLQRRSTNGEISNDLSGDYKICSVIERDDFPNTSEKTS